MDTIKTDTVQLVPYEPAHRPFLEKFHLPEEQRMFTSLPIPSLEKCGEEPDRKPVVILYKGVPAGFFVLHGEGAKEYSDNPQALLLRGYLIDEVYQGKGIANLSMKLLPDFARKNFPDKNEIVLGVNHANPAAQRVYAKNGFADRGNRIMGIKGEQFVYHLALD